MEVQPLHIEQENSTATTKSFSNLKYVGIPDDEETEPSVLQPEHERKSIFISYHSFEWKNYIFPPDIPLEVQLLRGNNIAIPACYLLVGCMQGMLGPLLNVYPLDLGATEAQQTTIASIATLPAAFKIVYGFLSDNVPIAGYRRKPYMLAGWLGASSLAGIFLYSLDFGTSYSENNQEETIAKVPTVQFMSLIFFLFGTCMWFADVMADSLVAQKARLEPLEHRGNLQSSCYACRFFGLMTAAPLSTLLYSTPNVNGSIWGGGPASIIAFLMFGPLLLVPFIIMLQEERDVVIKSTKQQCIEIWETVCTRSVWQPLGFTYMFNLLHVTNAAWRQYLKSVLGFTAAQLNVLLVASYVLLYMGTMTYKYCFLRASWRRLYQVCILLNAIFSSFQLLLIRGHTFGLSSFWFALGDDSFGEFLSGIQFLPVAIMMVHLVPVGSEGASYAMYTTFYNSAWLMAPAISTMLLRIWDVSKEALERGELDGIFYLTILTTVIQTSPILFLNWLPHGSDDLMALSHDDSEFANGNSHATSRVGGATFLTVLFFSMLYTFTVTIWNLLVQE